jgi:hypothetical protein
VLEATNCRCRKATVAQTCKKVRATRFILSSVGDSSYHQLMPKADGSNGGLKIGAKASDQALGPPLSFETITTAIHIPRHTWTLLRAVAFRRAQNDGGRASVSKLIAELVERHRKELERETK